MPKLSQLNPHKLRFHSCSHASVVCENESVCFLHEPLQVTVLAVKLCVCCARVKVSYVRSLKAALLNRSSAANDSDELMFANMKPVCARLSRINRLE